MLSSDVLFCFVFLILKDNFMRVATETLSRLEFFLASRGGLKRVECMHLLGCCAGSREHEVSQGMLFIESSPFLSTGYRTLQFPANS